MRVFGAMKSRRSFCFCFSGSKQKDSDGSSHKKVSHNKKSHRSRKKEADVDVDDGDHQGGYHATTTTSSNDAGMVATAVVVGATAAYASAMEGSGCGIFHAGGGGDACGWYNHTVILITTAMILSYTDFISFLLYCMQLGGRVVP